MVYLNWVLVEILPNLQTLTISRNYITEIPDWVCELKSIVRLKIWSSDIARISPEIGKLTNLTFLEISGRNIVN